MGLEASPATLHISYVFSLPLPNSELLPFPQTLTLPPPFPFLAADLASFVTERTEGIGK